MCVNWPEESLRNLSSFPKHRRKLHAFKPERQETVTTPQETVSIPLRRSQRTSKPPVRFTDYDVCAK